MAKTTVRKETKQELTAKQFMEKLSGLKSAKEVENVARYYKDEKSGNKIMGVKMGNLFKLAKEFTSLTIPEITKLLDNSYYEARMSAVSIMDFQARDKKTTTGRRKELYNLYIKKHNRINNWDLVDRSAPHVVGFYLLDKPRKILYKLARSKDPWERRTAIVSTWMFIKNNETADTFKIAELLVKDKHELVNKAVGSWIREAGKRDKGSLLNFLKKHAATMPRITLQYATEKLDKKTKDGFMKMKKEKL